MAFCGISSLLAFGWSHLFRSSRGRHARPELRQLFQLHSLSYWTVVVGNLSVSILLATFTLILASSCADLIHGCSRHCSWYPTPFIQLNWYTRTVSLPYTTGTHFRPSLSVLHPISLYSVLCCIAIIQWTSCRQTVGGIRLPSFFIAHNRGTSVNQTVYGIIRYLSISYGISVCSIQSCTLIMCVARTLTLWFRFILRSICYDRTSGSGSFNRTLLRSKLPCSWIRSVTLLFERSEGPLYTLVS